MSSCLLVMIDGCTTIVPGVTIADREEAMSLLPVKPAEDGAARIED